MARTVSAVSHTGGFEMGKTLDHNTEKLCLYDLTSLRLVDLPDICDGGVISLKMDSRYMTGHYLGSSHRQE